MKILLLTHGRAGSSSLHQALSDILNLEKVIEPFNKDLWNGEYKNRKLNFDGNVLDNTIQKTLSGTNDIWVRENASNFDKIIILARADIRDTCISVQNAKKHGYVNQYTQTETPTPNLISDIIHSYSVLFDFHRTLSSNLIWYEDIFNDYTLSRETIKSLDLNISDNQFQKIWDKYLHPSHRLQKDTIYGTNKQYSWISESYPPLKDDLI